MYFLKNKFYFFLVAVIIFSCKNNHEKNGDSSKNKDADSTIAEKRNLVSVRRAVIMPAPAGSPKILNVSNPLVFQTNTHVHAVADPVVITLPEKLVITTPGTDTFLLPKKNPAKGKIILCKQPLPVAALPPRFKDATICNLQYLDVDQGMNSPYVNCILSDKNGNIWFGTKGGVSKYDGRSFVHYTEKEGLSSNTVLSILQDKKGNLWFGTEGGGACLYDGKTFTRFSEEEGFSSNTVLSIIEDKKGNIWFGTNGGGALYYDGKTFTNYTEKEGLANNSVRGILEDKQGNIWFGTNGSGLSKFDGRSFTTFSENEGLSNNIVLSLFEDREGNLWFGVDEGGVNLFDGKSFKHYKEEQGLSNNSVLSILQDRSGDLWFGTYSGGANRFDGKTFTWFAEKEGLSNNYVKSMFEDNAGNLWLGTYGGGVNRYDGKLFTHYTGKEGLGSNTVRSVIEDKRGNIWFGTYGDGVISYDGKSFTHYNEKVGFSSNYVKASISDKNGNIWFGTDGGGVIKFDGKTFSNYTEEQGLCSDYIFSIMEDSNGNIWFGSDGSGASRFDGASFTTFSETEGLCNNTVLCMCQDNCGSIWFGTDGGGACRFDGEFFKYYTKKQGLGNNYVKTIFEDKEGNIWFGTDGRGLYYLDKASLCARQVEFKKINDKDGLSDNVITSILEDEKNNLWVATQNGLNYIATTKIKTAVAGSKDSVETISYQIQVYTTASGLKANNFFPNSALIDSKNNAWWGNGKALSMLNLNNFKLSSGTPSIQLNSIELEQTFIDFYALQDSLRSGNPMMVGDKTKKSLEKVTFSGLAGFYNYPKNLELPYYINHVTFHFSAIDWSAPDKIQYQYILEGIDKEWSPATYDNKALYSNLPCGDHTFKVRAIGLSQQWSSVVDYKFIIHPPWWKTWAAYILYVIIAIAIIYLLINWRTAQLRAQQKQLEMLVEERTAEVVEQKELIEEKQKEIVDSINYAQRIQKALLASDQLLTTHLKNYFLFFKPKDIVSGDFYWASLLANGNFALLTADSTGHGVPGAMMSMLNISCINEAINERKYTSPAKILDHARHRIIQSLSQDGSLEGGKDGMDCSLVVFDLKNKKLNYASANNPVWIVRKTAEAHELINLRSDRMPVGKHEKDNVPFTEHSFDLISGDVVYTLTDGFADQFGGTNGKKFKYKPLQEFLIAQVNENLNEQRTHLEKAFETWRGSLEQVDDVCIIGVKIE